MCFKKRRAELSEAEMRILEEKWHIHEEKRLRICQMHPEWPRTLEEAVTETIESLSEQGKETLRNMPEEKLALCHHALGMRIRNDFGMWTYNIELLKSCGYLPPDEASMVIIKAVWKKLKEKNMLPGV